MERTDVGKMPGTRPDMQFLIRHFDPQAVGADFLDMGGPLVDHDHVAPGALEIGSGATAVRACTDHSNLFTHGTLPDPVALRWRLNQANA